MSRRVKYRYDKIIVLHATRTFYGKSLAATMAYDFLRRWGSRTGYDAKRLQRVIIDSDDAETIYLFAKNVPMSKSCFRNLEEAIIKVGGVKWVMLFAELPGARSDILKNSAMIEEVMNT